MSRPDTSCPECGARQRRSGARYCAYCGIALPESALGAAPASAEDSRARLFEAMRQSQEMAEALAHEPPTTGVRRGMGFGLLFIGIWTAGALFMGMMALRGRSMGAPAALAIMPFAMAALGVLGFFQLKRKARRFAAAPLAKEPAIVVGKRTIVGEDSSQEYAALEFEEGDREEFALAGKLAGDLAQGDMVVAFIKDGMLLDCRRLGTVPSA